MNQQSGNWVDAVSNANLWFDPIVGDSTLNRPIQFSPHAV